MIISKLLGAGLIPSPQPWTTPDAAAEGASQIGKKGKQLALSQQQPQQQEPEESGASGIKKKLGAAIFKNFAAGGIE